MEKQLLVPHFTSTSGIGHLIRCFRIANSLPSDILVEKAYYNEVEELFSNTHTNNNPAISQVIVEPDISYRSIILDTQTITKEAVKHWKQFGKTIGIDIGGTGRSYTDYLIDTLPNTFKHRANYYHLGLSVPSDIVVSQQKSYLMRNILIYLHEKSLPYIEKIHEVCKSRYIQLTCAVSDKNMQSAVKKLGIHTIFGDIFLYKQMHTYDLFVSHFGLGIFEALKAGIPTVALNVSDYHQKLSDMVSLPQSFLQGEDLIHFLKHLDVKEYAALVRHCRKILPHNNVSIDGFLRFLLVHSDNNSTAMSQYTHCTNPCLGPRTDKVVLRFRESSVYKCNALQYWYQYPFLGNSPVYDAHYFEKEYKSQYGKTYLEDLKHIKQKMQKRLQHIQKIMLTHTGTHKDKKPVLLDIGAGYHAMLDIASKHNYVPVGTDINKDTIQYMQDNTEHYCFQSDASNNQWKDTVCDYLSHHKLENPSVICMWFTLEHFTTLQHTIYAIYHLLQKNGILAISVPNASGISARKNFAQFCKSSPSDHYSLFTPSGITAFLKKHGFQVKKKVNTGMHISRFPCSFLLSPVWIPMASLFTLGDTFEIYAIKR